MNKEELEKATGQELIDERNYCGVDGYYGVYLDNVNAEMLKRFNRLAELEEKLANADYQLEGREVELKELNTKLSQAEADYDKMFWQKNEIISKAKELLKWALHSDPEHDEDFEKKWEEAEQFLNSEVENEIHKL